MSQYMHSIPPKQFPIFSDPPHIFSQRINGLEKRWKNYHLTFGKKEGVGVSFLEGKEMSCNIKTHPLMFWNKKGGGYIYD